MGQATGKLTVTPELRQELRRRWVEALDSGKYPQTRGRLRDQNGYCCLGVACEVFNEFFPGELSFIGPDSDGLYAFGDFPYASEIQLPRVVAAAYGLSDPIGTIDGDDPLTDLNDVKKKTFPEIAAVIKSNPPGLFVD